MYDDRGTGESRFVSKDMYSELLAKCRCGRPRAGTHLIKCLQKVKPDYGHSQTGGLETGASKETTSGAWELGFVDFYFQFNFFCIPTSRQDSSDGQSSAIKHWNARHTTFLRRIPYLVEGLMISRIQIFLSAEGCS